jgi:hypothetical protein
VEGLVPITVDGERREVPRLWSMNVPEAPLVFRLEDAAEPAWYDVYRAEAAPGGVALERLIEGREPVGRIPAADVEIDPSQERLQLHTMGIERFLEA